MFSLLYITHDIKNIYIYLFHNQFDIFETEILKFLASADVII